MACDIGTRFFYSLRLDQGLLRGLLLIFLADEYFVAGLSYALQDFQQPGLLSLAFTSSSLMMTPKSVSWQMSPVGLNYWINFFFKPSNQNLGKSKVLEKATILIQHGHKTELPAAQLCKGRSDVCIEDPVGQATKHPGVSFSSCDVWERGSVFCVSFFPK